VESCKLILIQTHPSYEHLLCTDILRSSLEGI